MRQAVRDAFMQFSTRFESCLPYPYLDIKELVTVGVGNLIDPIETAIGLPFVKADWSLASRDEIAVGWRAVKARTDLAPRGGTAFREISGLMLTPEGIRHLVFTKLEANEERLVERFPFFPDFCADAQMGIFSVAWACGAAFHFPKFEAAILAQDWPTCAVESHMDDSHNSGLRPRNVATRTLFWNAAMRRDPDVLWYPRDLTSEPPDVA